MTTNTRKIGGDIKKHAVYKDIISIGYELETSGLAKMISEPDEEDEEKTVLLNTDSARDDISRLISGDFSDVMTHEEESYEQRINEAATLVIDAYDDDGHIDKNIHFVAGNDISETNFVKYNNKICRALLGKNKDTSKGKSASLSNKSVNELEKNQLYKFRPIGPISKTGSTGSKEVSLKRQKSMGEKEYDIHFVFWEDSVECGVFSDMEWVATYYKPKQQNKNIILDTFSNLARNLIRHLDEFVPIPGNLIITDGHTEFVVKKPETRILFHKPGTNLNYLQTHFSTILDKKTLSLDDVCITPQMTFAAHISKVYPVAKALVKDSIQSIDTSKQMFDNVLHVLNLVETCVKKLLRSYNKKAEKRLRIVEHRTNKDTVKEIQHLLMLMLYKLFVYINLYDTKGEDYFKDFLVINVRHSNYLLYAELKKALATLFHEDKAADKVSESTIIQVIQSIIVQESILKEYILTNESSIRKKAFDPNNRMEKGSSMYGDPAKSLISYLEFFEHPIEKDNIQYDRDGNTTHKIVFRDWLEYKQIDKFSAKLPLNDGVILIEFRVFSAAIISYLYSIKDPWIQENMTKGTCNDLLRNYTPGISKVSVGVLRRFVELYDKSKKKSNKVATGKRTVKKRAPKKVASSSQVIEKKIAVVKTV